MSLCAGWRRWVGSGRGAAGAKAPGRPQADLLLAASVIARAAASAMRASLRDLRESQTGGDAQPLAITGRLRDAFAILAGGCAI